MAINAVAEAVREGKELFVGEVALDGSNPTPVVTPFRIVSAVYLTLKGSAAPALSTSVVTYDVSANTVNIYGWKPTGAGDTTLVASTGTETVGYLIVGIR